MKTTPPASNRRAHRAAIFALIVLACGTFRGPSLAGTTEDVAAAIGRNDYEAAFKLLAPLAEAGDVEAQFALGSLLEWGKGTPVDFNDAATWYRRAAKQGHVVAQARLGRLLAGFSHNEAFNTGLARDDLQALFWLRQAAEGGEPSAMSALSIMYWKGRSVPKNIVFARMWNLVAQQLGDYDARLLNQNFASETSARETEEATRLAVEWLRAHRKQIAQ